MDLQLLYFDGCPNWIAFEQRLRAALRAVGSDANVTLVTVDTVEEAQSVQFRGSPSLLINGQDPFADRSAPVGLSCRAYLTPDGLRGTPTLEQLVEVLRPEWPSQT